MTRARRAKYSGVCITCKQVITAQVDVVDKNAAGYWVHEKCAEENVIGKLPGPVDRWPDQGSELGRQAALDGKTKRAMLAKMGWFNR